MNHGAYIFHPGLLNSEEIAEAANLAKELQSTKKPVHEAGKYSDLQWFQVDLDPDWDIIKKITDRLGAVSPELMVFYYLEPGARIHPHRDLTGASLNDRLRFHVPIITNPLVDFRVSKERIVMQPGDMWCLDTSYLHSVENYGDASRVHIVVECKVTPEIKANVPVGIKPVLHNAYYITVLATSLVKALAINTFRDPKYFVAQLSMIKRYIGWRFLKKGRPG